MEKYVDALIPGTYDFVTLDGERDFADMVKIKDLKWEIVLSYLGDLNLITVSLEIEENVRSGSERCDIRRT